MKNGMTLAPNTPFSCRGSINPVSGLWALRCYGLQEGGRGLPNEKIQSKTFTDVFGVCPQSSQGPVPPPPTLETPIPRRTVSLAWTVTSPAEFWATHSYTFSSRGVRSGWIRSTAPALPSNSIVCRGQRREVRLKPGSQGSRMWMSHANALQAEIGACICTSKGHCVYVGV